MSSPYVLRNLKVLETAGGVTLTANLYRDTLKVGTVEDDGRGGGNWVRFFCRSEGNQFASWVASLGTYTLALGAQTLTLPHNTESATELLIQAAEAALEVRKLDRAAQTNLIYRLAEDGENHHKTALPPSVNGKSVSEVVASYRQSAPWWTTVAEIWVPGQGWTPLERAAREWRS